MPIQKIPAAAMFHQGEGERKQKNKQPLTQNKVNNLVSRARDLANDEDKYQAAVDMARLKFSGEGREDVSDSELKQTIDNYYNLMEGKKSARDIRGDNIFTDMVSGAKEGIDAVNEGIGGAIDWTFDNTVGNLVGLLDEKSGQDVKNWMTGKDLSIIPDIATDIALYASGAGIPLAVAKNAIQLSPYLDQGFTGKDAITNEQMDFGQQMANLGIGLGGVALSAVPAIGKVKSIKDVVTGADAAASKAGKVVTEAAEATGKAQGAYDDALKKFAENIGQKEGGEAFFKEADGVVKPTDAFFRNTVDVSANPSVQASRMKEAEELFNSYVSDSEVKQLFDKLAPLRNAEEAAQGELKEAQRFADLSMPNRVGDIVRRDIEGFGQGIAETPQRVRAKMAELKNANNGKKIAKDISDKKIVPEEGQTPVDLFKQEAKKDYVRKLNSEKNLSDSELAELVNKLDESDIEKIAREYGVSVENGDLKVPVRDLSLRQRGAVRQAGKEERLKEIEKAAENEKTLSRKKIKEIVNKAENEKQEELLAGNMINPRAIGGGGRIARVRTVADDALDNIARKGNNAARYLDQSDADFRSLLSRLRKESVETGAKKKAIAAKNAAGEPLKRGADMFGGMAASMAMMPLAEQANNGGSYVDATDRLLDYYFGEGNGSPFGLAPILLPVGTKNIARKSLPSVRGYAGRSMAPHAAIRTAKTANLEGNLAGSREDTESDTYLDVLRNLYAKSKETE